MLDVGGWLLAVGCWQFAIGCWMLAIGCWLLAVGKKAKIFSWVVSCFLFILAALENNTACHLFDFYKINPIFADNPNFFGCCKCT